MLSKNTRHMLKIVTAIASLQCTNLTREEEIQQFQKFSCCCELVLTALKLTDITYREMITGVSKDHRA